MFTNVGSVVVLLFFILYLYITFTTPQTETGKAQFQLSDTKLFFIRLSIGIPYFFMWFATFYSARTLAIQAKKTTALQQLHTALSRGFLFLLIGTIATTILGAIRSKLLVSNPSILPGFTILINYLYVFIPATAFYQILIGLKKTDVSEKLKLSASEGHFLQALLITVVIGLVYVPLVFTNPNRQVAFNTESAASYYLSDPVMVVTLLLPTLLTWMLGIYVTLKLSKVFLKLGYENITSFINGFYLVILSSMLLQAILSLGTERLYEFGLGAILLLVYLLIFSQTGGYMLIARGVAALSNK